MEIQTVLWHRPAGGAHPSLPHRPPHCAHGSSVPSRAPRLPRQSAPEPGGARRGVSLAGAGQAPQDGGGERAGMPWSAGSLGKPIASIRAVARGFAVDPNTVLGWLVEAADHLEAFSRYFLRDVDVEQVQMDELFAMLSAVKDGEVTETQAIKHLSRSPYRVWVAMDPVCMLILTVNVGQRILERAQ